MKKILFLILFLLPFIVCSQRNNEFRIAQKYYNEKNYKLASPIFLKLYNKTRSKTNYTYYVKCQIELKEYDNLVKFVKRISKKYRTTPKYKIDLAYIYELQNKFKKSEKIHKSLIDRLPKNKFYIENLANSFSALNKHNKALEVYLKARKIYQNPNMFRYQVGNTHRYLFNYKEMVNEYLELLMINKSFLSNVKNLFSNTLSINIDDSFKPILKEILLKKIKEYPQNESLKEILVWLYIKEEKYASAFNIARSLNLRYNKDGNELFNIGILAKKNKEYTVAIQAFEFIINNVVNSNYKSGAKTELLDTKFKQLINSENKNKEEIVKIIDLYKSELKKNKSTRDRVNLIVKMCHINAFYLKNYDESIIELEKAAKQYKYNRKYKNKCNLKLAEIYILADKIWDATLLYAAIENENKNSSIYSEVKFYRAQTAYYTGNFSWAKSQLDALKASTSKLIANDAAYLSDFIHNSYNENDSINSNLTKLAKAELLSRQNRDSLAIIKIDSILNNSNEENILCNAYFLKHKLCIKTKDYTEAINCLKKIYENYPKNLLTDDSLFILANLYKTITFEMEKAKEIYKILIQNYSGSIFSTDAIILYRKLLKS